MFGTVDIIKKTLTNEVTSLIFGGDEHKDWRDTEAGTGSAGDDDNDAVSATVVSTGQQHLVWAFTTHHVPANVLLHNGKTCASVPVHNGKTCFF